MRFLLIFLLFVSSVFCADKTPIHKYSLGWSGDDGSKRATSFRSMPGYAQLKISPKSDLTSKMPPIRNQGNLGSCTGFGTARALDYLYNVKYKDFFNPSPLFIYYHGRVKIGTIYEDSGAQIVDTVSSILQYGAPKSTFWLYRVNKFTVKPSSNAYHNALNYKGLHAYKVDNTDKVSIRRALSNGFPVVIGFLVYSDFEKLNKNDYILEMPRRGERYLGGHCVILTSHDDSKSLYGIDNSWSMSWGNRGRALIPYEYIHNGRISEDAWVISIIK